MVTAHNLGNGLIGLNGLERGITDGGMSMPLLLQGGVDVRKVREVAQRPGCLMNFVLERRAYFSYIMRGNYAFRPFWIKRQCALWQSLQEQLGNCSCNKAMIKHCAASKRCAMIIRLCQALIELNGCKILFGGTSTQHLVSPPQVSRVSIAKRPEGQKFSDVASMPTS